MNYFGDFAVVVCMWTWAFAIASFLQRRRWVHTHAVGQLIGLVCIAALGWVACLIGYGPAEGRVPPLEMLVVHPVFGSAVWFGGFIGGANAVYRAYHTPGLAAFKLTRSEVCGIWVGGLTLLGAWACSLAPPLRVDEGMYHLALPLQYVVHGGYVAVEGHGNSGFFALADMLFWWCLMAGAPGAARQMQLLVTIIGWFALVTQTSALVRPRIIWAFCVWLCVPIVFWELGCAYVDVIEAVLTLVALSCLARWYGGCEPRDDCYLAQSAWLFGAAAATRQLALSSLPALGLVVLWRLRADAQTGNEAYKPRRAAMASALCLVLPSLFVWHNVCVFGNPLYPFAMDFFAQGARLKASQLQVLDQFLAQHGPMLAGASRTGWDALWHLPWALLFEAAFASPSFDGVVGPLPLIAACVALYLSFDRAALNVWAAEGRCERRLLLGFAGVRTAVWLSTSWQARFLIMPLGALSLWTCYAWPKWNASLRFSAASGQAARLLSAGAMLCALGQLRGHLPAWDWRYLGSPTSRHQARLQQMPASGLCERISQRESAARVMLVWTQRLAAFCPTALWSDSYDEAASLIAWLEADKDLDVVARLHQAHITHLLVDEAALVQRSAGVDAAERSRWQQLVERWQSLRRHDLRLEGAEGAIRLYAVRAP